MNNKKTTTETSIDEIAELKKIIKHQQDTIKRYQQKLLHKSIEGFRNGSLSPFGSLYYGIYSYVLRIKTPITILRGHVQMLQKKIGSLDPTNAFLLSEEFNLFEKNISQIYDTLSSIDSLHAAVPHKHAAIRICKHVSHVLDRLKPSLEKNRIQITCACPEHISLRIDTLLLDLLIINMVRAVVQAIQAGAAGAAVHLSSVATDSSVMICCTNKAEAYAMPDPDTEPAASALEEKHGEYLLRALADEIHGRVEVRQDQTTIMIVLEIPINEQEN